MKKPFNFFVIFLIAGLLVSPVVIAQTQEDVSVSVTITSGETPTPPDGPGGGGGGGGGVPGPATLVLEGVAYPNALITILKNGSVLRTLEAEPSASFTATMTGLNPGITTISLWAEDNRGEKSVTISYTITLIADSTTTISGLNLPPTLSLSHVSIRRGNNITIYGQTYPASEVYVFVNSEGEIVKSAKASDSGLWQYDFDTGLIEIGSHVARARSVFIGGQTVFSGIKTFQVVAADAPLGICLADLNNDGFVDIIDFSILLYNWGIPVNNAADFNSDGEVNIIDFSIMLFYWGSCPA